MTAENISSAGTVRLQARYPATYGWGSPAKTAANQLPFIMAVAGFLIVMGSVGAVVMNE